MRYKTKDRVLPVLQFEYYPVDIHIDISESRVQLFVANRDWIWDKDTGKFIGAGCSGPFTAPGKTLEV